MATNQELQAICDRGLQAIAEVKAHAVRLGQLDQEVKAKQGELAALQNQIVQAKTLAGEIDEVHQTLRAKRADLAELNAEIARKHAVHGKVDADLRDLRKRISGDPTHA
jgi:chromosome segregation ATPase